MTTEQIQGLRRGDSFHSNNGNNFIWHILGVQGNCVEMAMKPGGAYVGLAYTHDHAWFANFTFVPRPLQVGDAIDHVDRAKQLRAGDVLRREKHGPETVEVLEVDDTGIKFKFNFKSGSPTGSFWPFVPMNWSPREKMFVQSLASQSPVLTLRGIAVSDGYSPSKDFLEGIRTGLYVGDVEVISLAAVPAPVTQPPTNLVEKLGNAYRAFVSTGLTPVVGMRVAALEHKRATDFGTIVSSETGLRIKWDKLDGCAVGSLHLDACLSATNPWIGFVRNPDPMPVGGTPDSTLAATPAPEIRQPWKVAYDAFVAARPFGVFKVWDERFFKQAFELGGDHQLVSFIKERKRLQAEVQDTRAGWNKASGETSEVKRIVRKYLANRDGIITKLNTINQEHANSLTALIELAK